MRKIIVFFSLLLFSVLSFAQLSDTQKIAFKAALAAETDTTLVAYRNARDTGAIRAWYNSAASPDFFVWRTEVPTTEVLDAISFDKYTPTDAPDTTAIWQNRAFAAQIKQINLQLLLQGRSTLDASKANVRAALRDAVIQLPTGASGAAVSPGGASGATTLTACLRKARRIEKLFSVSSATTGSVTGNLLVYEGQVSELDVVEAL